MEPAALKVRVQKWRDRAAQIRAIAVGVKDDAARRQLMETAQGYEAMADHAERTAREQETKSSAH
jgi:hypothetical protein